MPTAALPDEILTPGDKQVKALICLGGNPMLAWPDQLKTFEAMKALDLLVCLDPRMSKTAELADYVIAPKLHYVGPWQHRRARTLWRLWCRLGVRE